MEDSLKLKIKINSTYDQHIHTVIKPTFAHKILHILSLLPIFPRRFTNTTKLFITIIGLLCLIMILVLCFVLTLYVGQFSAQVSNAESKEPHDDLLKSNNPTAVLNFLIELIGWAYFASWSISMYPQVFLNRNRKSVEGLNFDFLLLNMIGHSCYMVYNLAFYFSSSVQTEYFEIHKGGVNPVLLNDVFFSVHASIITAFTVYQCFIYDTAGQKISKIGGSLAAVLVGYLIFSGFLEFIGGINSLEYAYAFSYVKLVVTFSKYMPQAYMNYVRKSTRGWSIENVLLDFIGGVLSIVQMFLLAYNFNDWTSILGSPTKLGLGLVTIIYDTIFIIQHYFLYPEILLK